MIRFAFSGSPHLLDVDPATFERVTMAYLDAIRQRFHVAYRPKSLRISLSMGRSKGNDLVLAGITRIRSRGQAMTIDLKVRAPEGVTVSMRRFAPIVVHELFHLVVPIVDGSLLWTEGVTDFCAHLFLGLLDDLPLKLAYVESLRASDPAYYRFKRPYVRGANAMLGLYRRDQRATMANLSALVRDANRDAASVFAPCTKADIVRYDPRFDVFFRRGPQAGQKGDWNTETPKTA